MVCIFRRHCLLQPNQEASGAASIKVEKEEEKLKILVEEVAGFSKGYVFDLGISVGIQEQGESCQRISNLGISSVQPIETFNDAFRKFLAHSMRRLPKAPKEDSAEERSPARSFGTVRAKTRKG